MSRVSHCRWSVLMTRDDHFFVETAANGWALEKNGLELRAKFLGTGPVDVGFVGMVDWVGSCQNAHEEVYVLAISLTRASDGLTIQPHSPQSSLLALLISPPSSRPSSQTLQTSVIFL